MRRSLVDEWKHLRTAIDKVEADIARSAPVRPAECMLSLLIVGEDRRYFRHPGVDLVALGRAFWKTLQGEPQGGSTIAMQLVRTLTGNYERTWSRKLREIALAILLTRCKGRERLPCLYLWVAYYGWKMNGFLQACARLRLKPCDMSIQESAMFVARLKYPEPQAQNSKRISQIHGRARHLLSLMRMPISTETTGKLAERWNHSK